MTTENQNPDSRVVAVDHPRLVLGSSEPPSATECPRCFVGMVLDDPTARRARAIGQCVYCKGTGLLSQLATSRSRSRSRSLCEDCGTKIIDRCPKCGAPQCCPKCCDEATLELGVRRAVTQGLRDIYSCGRAWDVVDPVRPASSDIIQFTKLKTA